MKGTVLEDLGFASIIYTLSSFIANWILMSPTVLRATAIFCVYFLIWLITKSPKLYGGSTAFESPEWIPAGSTCSIIPIIYTFFPSHMASASASIAPSRKWSNNIFPSGLSLIKSTTCSSSSFSLITIFIDWPPKTYEGLTRSGNPIFLDNSIASVAVSIVPYSGYGILFSFNKSENLPLSSAKSNASKEVPKILMP